MARCFCIQVIKDKAIYINRRRMHLTNTELYFKGNFSLRDRNKDNGESTHFNMALIEIKLLVSSVIIPRENEGI